MKIYSDISVLTLATFMTGIQRVTVEILVRLAENIGEDLVLLHYNARENMYHKVDNRLFLQYYVEKRGKKEKMVTKRQLPLEEMQPGDVLFDVDATWMCRVKRSYLFPILKKQGVRIVVQIHDIISVEYPQFCLERGVYNYMDYLGAALQYGDTFIVSTHAIVDSLERLAKSLGILLPPCQVVPFGADYIESQESAEELVKNNEKILPEIRDLAAEKTYILMVGTIEPRKNHRLLLDAYDAQLKGRGYSVVLAGYMGWNMEDFRERLETHPDFGRGVYHFSGLDDDNISYLYRHARYMAFLSYSEGFGLPLIEAFYRGTPVIASDIPVSREVAGDYCVYFAQDDVEDFCGKIRELDDQPERYQRMKERLAAYRAVTWEENARQMREILLSI